jgi:SPP1 family predicted phage head-tail adaptor
MRAGKLRTLATFQSQAETADNYGGKTIAWTAVYTNVPCEFRATVGSEVVESGRIEERLTAVLTARAKAVVGVAADYRVVIDSIPWNIRQVIPIGQRSQMVDFVIERAGDGVAT